MSGKLFKYPEYYNVTLARRRNPVGAWLISAAVHCLFLAALLQRPEPKFYQPSSALRGDGGGNVTQLVFSTPGRSALEYRAELASEEPERNRLTAPASKPKPRRAAQPVPQPPTVQVASDKPGRPGFILGSEYIGVPSDHDIRIAYPIFHPDPAINRAALPEWIRGDVILEIIIDHTGIVTEAKVLQTVGFGLEAKVLEAVKNWRYKPATFDGMPVASKQDVRFHFPS